MSLRSPISMKMIDSYLRTAVSAESSDEHGCLSVRLFSKEKMWGWTRSSKEMLDILLEKRKDHDND